MLVILLIVVLPFLNGIGLSDYYLNLCGKYLTLAILALGMDLIWGYTGILSLGQAIFFGFGAYAMGMYLMLASSGQGVYGEPIPDFMVWNRVLELPLFWKPFQYFLSCALGPAVACLRRHHHRIVDLSPPRRRTYFAI
jgi:urea transport system permease protein